MCSLLMMVDCRLCFLKRMESSSGVEGLIEICGISFAGFAVFGFFGSSLGCVESWLPNSDCFLD